LDDRKQTNAMGLAEIHAFLSAPDVRRMGVRRVPMRRFRSRAQPQSRFLAIKPGFLASNM
jgi:hypothetical protein